MAFNDKGFIIDAPKVLLQTDSGNSHLATAKQGTVTLGGDSIEIMGGWSFYNLARIDTKKTLNISLTDAQWDYDQLWLTSGGAKTTAASSFYYFGTAYTVSASTYRVTLTGHLATAGTIEINGYTDVTSTSCTPSTTEFWAYTSGSDTVIEFSSSAAGEVV